MTKEVDQRIYTCDWSADPAELQQLLFQLFSRVLADLGVGSDRVLMLAGGHIPSDVLAQRVTVAVRPQPARPAPSLPSYPGEQGYP